MKVIPSETINIISSLKREDIILIFKNATQKNKGLKADFFFKTGLNDYEGFINNDKFGLQRILYHRNSFSPQINGTIYEKDEKSSIQLNLELRSYPLIFVLIVFTAISMTFIAMLIGFFTQGFSILYCIIPLLVFLFIQIGMNLEFNRESEIIKTDLINLFRGTIK